MIGVDARRLAAAIIETGLGQAELCVKAGIAHQTLAKMLKGEMVRFPSVSRICKILDIVPTQILKEVGETSGGPSNETV